MSTEPAPTASRAWQESLDPQLAARLQRPLAQPGIVSMAVVRRILGWVDAFGSRLPLLAELRRRGQAGARDVERLPIVHARWVADEAPEERWPDTGGPSPRVVERVLGDQVSMTVNTVVVTPGVPAEVSAKEPLAAPVVVTASRAEQAAVPPALPEARAERPQAPPVVVVEHAPERAPSSIDEPREAPRRAPILAEVARPSDSPAPDQRSLPIAGDVRVEERLIHVPGAPVVMEVAPPVVGEPRAPRPAAPVEQPMVVVPARASREGVPAIPDLAGAMPLPAVEEPAPPRARPAAWGAEGAELVKGAEVPSAPVAARRMPVVRPRSIPQDPERPALAPAAAPPATSPEGARIPRRIEPPVRMPERAATTDSPAEARALPLVRARAPQSPVGRAARTRGLDHEGAASDVAPAVSAGRQGPAPARARKQPLPRVAPTEPARDAVMPREPLSHVSTRIEAPATAAQSAEREPPFAASPEPPAAPRAARSQVVAEPPAAGRKDEIDIDKLVDTVQRKLLRRLAAERERRGMR